MILHTTEVTPLPGHRLFLRFNDGTAGEVDLSGELDGEIFEPLRAPALFNTAHQHPVMKTVAWANGADLAPEFLRELMEQQHGERAA
ncbi:MAG: hypothetical protein A2286_12505 [Gammaproteobacteria bacterium RIFOXYA12_FULL_61_12]|nr:MAG: hypothetical protein A2514_15615 [Gammaproteobacteria bacterium RIFOXYD12_FULL_61_37]OGT94309.1 MAG: hypothetical protein A2286_12505 [Gammaproteobacteria bacterium RIFOXYA12_FULL_61_12]